MSIVVNNNMMAANAARSLNGTYRKLAASVQRMSSGLRINTSADDAAGLAIRELMRADIRVSQQGLRNVADGISLIQTADGALAIIDEKLTRMKELAEQAATATYSTIQRDMINSEYQAMAKEIDRIANAANFNGVKLLDGSVSNLHGGRGLKIHFGVSNKEAEDYYFVNMGDARATSSTGLRVGGDAKNDIWAQGAAASSTLTGPGCCTAGYGGLNSPAGFTSGDSFAFGYNWDWREDQDPRLLSGKYLTGRYTVGASDSLQDLIDQVNSGSQSRVGLRIDAAALEQAVKTGGTAAVCLGEESYYWGHQSIATGGPYNYYTYHYDPGLYRRGANGVNLAANNQATANLLSNRGLSLSKIPGLTAEVDGGFEKEAVKIAYDDINQDRQSLLAELGGSNTLMLDAVRSSVSNPIDQGGYTNNGDIQNKVIAAGGLSELGSALTSNIMISFPDIYADANGNWTLSADVAQAYGWAAMRFTVTPHEAATGTAAAALIEARIKAMDCFISVSAPFDPGDIAPLTETGLSASRQMTTREVSGFLPKDRETVVRIGGHADEKAAFTAQALASAINHNPISQFWAMTQSDNLLYVFNKEGGDYNSLTACEAAGPNAASKRALEAISFEHVESGEMLAEGSTFSLGGHKWGQLSPVQTRASQSHEVWNLSLAGRDVGLERDLWIANQGEIKTPGLKWNIISGLDRDSFIEVQNAADAAWAGAELRSQSSAQEALAAIGEAITRKDVIRADLGAMQNRLENTMCNLEIQAENLQSAESRISDVDVAMEMTEFTKNNVLVQAGVSMLAQANSLSQLALSLLG